MAFVGEAVSHGEWVERVAGVHVCMCACVFWEVNSLSVRSIRVVTVVSDGFELLFVITHQFALSVRSIRGDGGGRPFVKFFFVVAHHFARERTPC